MDNTSQGGQVNSTIKQNLNEVEMIKINNLAEMTGFPKDFITSELLLGHNDDVEISIDDLRTKVTQYLMKSEFSE